jgi:phosphoribosylformylglycinamidine synthase
LRGIKVTKDKTVRARVTVFPRPEILDPQGKAIGEALARLGFDKVNEVRAGKSFDVELRGAGAGEAQDLLKEMSEKLLANPIVEDYSIELLPRSRGES